MQWIPHQDFTPAPLLPCLQTYVQPEGKKTTALAAFFSFHRVGQAIYQFIVLLICSWATIYQLLHVVFFGDLEGCVLFARFTVLKVQVGGTAQRCKPHGVEVDGEPQRGWEATREIGRSAQKDPQNSSAGSVCFVS